MKLFIDSEPLFSVLDLILFKILDHCGGNLNEQFIKNRLCEKVEQFVVSEQTLLLYIVVRNKFISPLRSLIQR